MCIALRALISLMIVEIEPIIPARGVTPETLAWKPEDLILN